MCEADRRDCYCIVYYYSFLDCENKYSLSNYCQDVNVCFVDYGGTTRQISDIGMVQNTNSNSGAGASQNRANLIWFGIEGNAANDANTFNQITFYDNSGNGNISIGIILINCICIGKTTNFPGFNTLWTRHVD